MIDRAALKSPLKNKFFQKIIESFFGKASFALFTMVFSLVATRLYGAETFGQYTYAFSIVTLLMIFAKAGFDNSLIYYIPKQGTKYISLSFLVNAIIALLLTIGAGFFIEDYFVKMMLPLIWLVSMEQVFFGIYRSTDRVKQYYLINGFLAILLRVILIIVFYFLFGKTFTSIALAIYVSFIFANLIYFYQNKHMFKKVVYDQKFLNYSYSLVLAAVMGVAMDKIDIIMLGSMKDMESVGIYQIDVQIANVILMILVIFDTVFAPQISKFYHEGKHEELRRLYKKSTRLLGLLALIALLIVIIFGKYILLMFGEEFVEGYLALILRSFGQFINVAVGSVWLMLAMTGRPKWHIYSNLIAFSVNICLNYLLIPKYGVNGAAFATMISMVLVNILGYILVRRVFKVKVYGII
ncbi:flippase [Domibacillus robiginosus]|uniref:flippase n=1 Tax=Domibacillus robiginosus TaxID=1071054 RepID=UPI00067D7A52|nr:flippase [Domibacillus robiginosus]